MTSPVLIVEDNATKRAAIERALTLPDKTLELAAASSIANAYRALDGKKWDLIILDMTFQVSQTVGGEIANEALAGIELLQYMTRRRIRSPVIVATQHSSFTSPGLPGIDSVEKLDALLKRLFPANYRTTVLVDLAGERWKKTLQQATSEVLNGGSQNLGHRRQPG